jgi:transcriptional regulator with GAF, ATPase, and Fis domain
MLYWLKYVGPNIDANLQQSVEEALRQTGLSLQESRSGPGIVFFSVPSQELVETLRDLSCGGRERVLALAAREATLSSDTSWRLLDAGASDVLAWNEHARTAQDVAARLERWAGIDRLVGSRLVTNSVVGQSPAWLAVLRQAVEVGAFTGASVLLTGESGTGKELVARLIHSLDPRSEKGELVLLDCTTVVPDLSGSEFFGHERGAFTGAVTSREGAFGLANGGTLFLDEVGELPPALQAQLLRVVQEGVYKRVGGNTWHKTAFRLVSATNRDLFHQVEIGQFRRDLFYRIATVTLRLPPLHERSEDILPLARHFLAEFGCAQPVEMHPAVGSYLLRRPYPGNVRDLKQLAARMSYRHTGAGPITAGDLPPDERPHADSTGESWPDSSFENSIRAAVASGLGLKGIGRAASETAIRIAIEAEDGNLARAARKLGITDRALQLRRANERSRVSALTDQPSAGSIRTDCAPP